MAELIDEVDIFLEKVYDILVATKPVTGLVDVWFGDQDRLPTTPCAAVEPGPKRRTYNGAPRRYLVELSSYILVYSNKVQDSQANEREACAVAERVEDVLHADGTLGGIVIDSYVSTSEPGYATRGDTKLRATRLTFEARSQKMLPYST